MFLMDLKEEHRKTFLDLAQYTMRVDMCVTSSESWMLMKFTEECGFFDNEYRPRKRPLEEIMRDFENTSRSDKKIIIFELYRMILADGQFHEKQKELVKTIAERWKLKMEEINEIIDLSQKLIDMSLKCYKKLVVD